MQFIKLFEFFQYLFIICEVIPLFGFKKGVFCHKLKELSLFLVPLNAGEHGIMCTKEDIKVG